MLLELELRVDRTRSPPLALMATGSRTWEGHPRPGQCDLLRMEPQAQLWAVTHFPPDAKHLAPPRHPNECPCICLWG